MKLSDELVDERAQAAQDRDAEWAQVKSNMRSFLKQQSKNELIKIVFEQFGLYIEQREANKVLLERLKEYENAASSGSDSSEPQS